MRVSPDWSVFSGVTDAPVSDERETENAYGILRASLPRRRTTNPKLSPCTAPAEARAVICMTAVPPGTSVTGAASTVAPADATCALTSATHVPSPPPASVSATEIDLEFAPPPATR